MTRHVRTLLVLFVVFIALMATCFLLYDPDPTHNTGLAHVYMLDIGQGDSFLIEAADGKKLLIDGGRDTTVLSELAKVLPPGDTTIDIMIATHPDADHIGGLQYVLQRYHVGLFLTSQVLTDTKTFTDLYKELLKEHIPSYYVRRGMVLTLDTVHLTTFTVLFPDRDTTNWITNPASIVGRLDVYTSNSLNNSLYNKTTSSGVGGMRSILFTDDSPSSVEHFLVQTDGSTSLTTSSLSLKADVLKLGHHGSKYSSGTEYLKAVSPVLGLISAGINNKYGHPNAETLVRLKALNIPWISTQQKGTVELTTDGTKEWMWKSV
jgi:beta-lactamase superfamily II metal-dependent hydrolase